MKKVIALSLAIASTATVPMSGYAATYAANHSDTHGKVQAQRNVKTELKQASVFTSASVLGAIAGGPIGMMIGAIGGAYLGEQVEKADQLKEVELAQADAERKAQHLTNALAERNVALEQMQQQALDQLQLQVLFLTASDRLTPQGEEQIKILAGFLSKNPQLNIHLHGYADPRGTEDYNEVLSHYRTLTVQQALETAGIDPSRISLTAHGANRDKTAADNADTYALERRVEIEITNPQHPALTMQ